jgi:hypothetical protein
MEYLPEDNNDAIESEEQYWTEINTTWLENYEGTLVDAIHKAATRSKPSVQDLPEFDGDWLDTMIFIKNIK